MAGAQAGAVQAHELRGGGPDRRGDGERDHLPSLLRVGETTRDQVRNLTVLVFAVSFVVGLYITGLDAIFTQVVARLLLAGG